MAGSHTLNPSSVKTDVDSGPPPRHSYESEVDEVSRKGVVLDGITTSTPNSYPGLDPKSREERGMDQFRRKPKDHIRFTSRAAEREGKSTTMSYDKVPITSSWF